MAASYYDLIGVLPTAPLDEIKKAFRREIAKYHPDKVQHLGREFQEIAAVKAAALTQAYKTLCDDALRAEYDAGLAGEHASGGAPPPAAPPDAARRSTPASPSAEPAAARPAEKPAEPSRAPAGSTFAADRAGASDLVRKAAIARFRQVLVAEFGHCEETPVQGFEVACAPPKGGFFSKLPPRILGRFVAQVDAATVAEAWSLAARMPKDKESRDVCVFLMGPAVAPASQLARAIAEERRRPVAHKLFLVPLNTRSWAAHIPADAPGVVKTLVEKLKSL